MEFKHLEKIAGLLEEEIPLPEGAKAIHAEVEAREIEKKVKNILERYKNTDAYDSEVFKSTNKLISQTKKGLERIREEIKNKQKEMESEINVKYTCPIKGISSQYKGYGSIIENYLQEMPKFVPTFSELWTTKNSKIEQEDFEIGKPILNYFPYGVDFSKEEIQIRNLYTGKKESSKKFFPEMNGFTSVSPSTRLETISARLWFYKTQQLGKDNLKKKDKTIVRDMLGKIGEEEVLWFYPIYEVPIISKRKAKSRQKVLYIGGNDLSKFKIDILEQKVPFESSGAFFYDALTGEEIDRLFVDSYFKRAEKSSRGMDYRMEVIKTKGLDLGSTGTFEISPKSVDHKKYILSGTVIGAFPGIFTGSPAGFWSGLILGASTGVMVGEVIKSIRKGIVSEKFNVLSRYFENLKVW